MSKLVFKPNLQKRRSYSVVPDDQNLRRGLNMIFSRGNLRLVIEYALTRTSWMAEFGWGGIEYPTRADRAGQVRYCWLPVRFGAEKVRKCHAPESEYLGLLLGVARHNGWYKQVRALEALNPQPIDVRLTPDIYALEDYTTGGPIVALCLAVILGRFDLERSRSLAQQQQGFAEQSKRGTVLYGWEELEYLPAGKLRIKAMGVEKIVPEKKYLEVLDTVLALHGLEPLGDNHV